MIRILVILNSIFVIALSSFFGNIAGGFFVVVLYQLINCLFLKKTELLLLFNLSFLVNVIFLCLTSTLFYWNLGSIYGANDELKLYFKILEAVNFWILGDYVLPSTESYIWSGLSTVISFVFYQSGEGIGVAIKLFSVIFGSLLPPVLYLFSRQFFNNREALFVGFSSVFFFINVFYSVVGVRDAHIAVLTLVALLLADKSAISVDIKNSCKNIFLCGIVVLLMHGFRGENCYFLIVFVTAYIIIIKLTKRGIYLVYNFAALLCVGLFLFYDHTIGKIMESYIYTVTDFSKISSKASESLANALRGLPVPLNFLSISFVALSGSFPPSRLMESPFLQQGTIDGFVNVYPMVNFSPARLLKAVGYFIWQFLLVHYCCYRILNSDRTIELRKALLLTFVLLYMGLVGWASLNEGRLYVFYPLILPFVTVIFYRALYQRHISLIIAGALYIGIFFSYHIAKSLV